MKDVCKVTVIQSNENVVRFEFNNTADALTFVDTCLECGDSSTEVFIKIERAEK